MANAITKPASSTITWATLAGLATSGVWEALDTFTELEIGAGLVSVSTALIAGVVGKLVPEKQYKMELIPK